MSRGRNPRRPRAHGQLRQSQLVGGYGPGSLLDLPHHSVIVGGLDQWGDPDRDRFRSVHDDRLLERVRKALGQGIRMYAPPVDSSQDGTGAGITAWVFPEWFVVQHEMRSPADVRTRRMVQRSGLTRGAFPPPREWELKSKRPLPVVPMRFVKACPHGHIADVDWRGFAHEYQGDCRRPIWLDERGTTGDIADLSVRCECGVSRSLATALKRAEGNPPLGWCQGERPWLGQYARERCGGEDGKPQPSKLLVRSASDAYFAQTIGVIAIPEHDDALKKAIDVVWDTYLQYAESAADVARERKKGPVAAAIGPFSDAAVWAEIQRRRGGDASSGNGKTIKHAEIETLLAQAESDSDDVADSDFHAVAVPLPKMADRSPLMRKIEKVVLVHRLREVIAQIGFTRFEPQTPDVDGELDLEVRRASLSKEPTWVPAIENRGEGVLVALRPEALEEWAARDAVKRRVEQLSDGFEIWKNRDLAAREKRVFPGARYVALHSLSHLLVDAVSLACGYSATSLRERIYVTDVGCGILVYTGSSDSEGTLGGLVQVGRELEKHLRAALERGMLCSNDPVCAQHRPDEPKEERYLHGAACHGCVLIGETSCEKHNELLDRALVVPTVEGLGAELFGDEDLA